MHTQLSTTLLYNQRALLYESLYTEWLEAIQLAEWCGTKVGGWLN